MEVLEASKDRVMPECPVARQCGGCQLQMMSYEAQLHFKERKVYNNLRRIGGMENLRLPEQADEVSVPENVSERNTSERMETTDAGVKAENVSGKSAGEGVDKTITMEPILGMEYPWRYRNKAQFPFGRDKDGRIIAGFYAGRTHHIVEAEDCLLGVEENAVILDIIKKIMEEYQIAPYDEETHKGLIRHALIRKGFSNGRADGLSRHQWKEAAARGYFCGTLKRSPWHDQYFLQHQSGKNKRDSWCGACKFIRTWLYHR